MLTRPHYSKSVNVNAAVIKRKLKPRHHSFHIDAQLNLDLIVPSINTAREYNLKEGKRVIDAVMVIFYGASKDGLSRDSSTPLITIGSSNDFIMRIVDKALNKLRQSDAQPRFMRIVYDMNKAETQAKAEKQSAAVLDAAKKLNTAKSFGFTNFNDYINSLRKLNKKLKHGATEKTLKREAQKIAKEKGQTKIPKRTSETTS